MPNHWTGIFGGSEYQVRCLLDVLVKCRGFEITYLTRYVDPGYAADGYAVQRIGSGDGVGRYGFVFDAPRLLGTLKRIRPDVIYQREGTAYTGIAAYYSRDNNCRLVWHISSDSDVDRMARRPYFGNFISRYVDDKVLAYGISHGDKVIAQSRHQADLLFKHYAREVTAVVPNFHPRPREEIEKGSEIRVVWAANLKAFKQPETFIALAKELGSHHRVRFTMLGRAGASRWHHEVLRKIAAVPELEYLGERSQDEVNQVLASAHIFVNTSLYEGFPNTFIQAWMRKVPVVSLHADPDGILHRNGVGFRCGTYDALRDRVALLIENDSLRREMGERAQHYAFEHHSMKNADRIVEILEP
jgi:glycosyltransferase involved in cell wall biosynthesis